MARLSPPFWIPQTVFNFTPPASDSIRCIAAHPVTGDIYFGTVDSVNDPIPGPVLWRWNRQTGLIESKGSISQLARLQGMEFDRTGTLYGWEPSTGTTAGKGLVRINVSNSLASDVFPASLAPGLGSSVYNIQSLDFDGDGICYLASQQAIYRLSPASDNLTLVSTYTNAIPSDFRGIAIIPSSFGAWQKTAFPATAGYAQVSPAMDYDMDGLQNFVEYALGTDPAVPNGPPAAALVEADGGSYLTLQWNRPANRGDVLVTGEVTDAPGTSPWLGEPDHTLTQITQEPDGTETVIIRDRLPVGSAGSSRFLRPRFSR